MLEVTDLYDAFYGVIEIIATKFEFHMDYRNLHFVGLRLDEVIDHLEQDLFFSACARRAGIFSKNEGLNITEVRRRLLITDLNGCPFEGQASSYHSHGFDWDLSGIKNLIVGGDSVPRNRNEVRVFFNTGK